MPIVALPAHFDGKHICLDEHFEKLNILITGPCGAGKSYLACALEHRACREIHPDFSSGPERE